MINEVRVIRLKVSLIYIIEHASRRAPPPPVLGIVDSRLSVLGDLKLRASFAPA